MTDTELDLAVAEAVGLRQRNAPGSGGALCVFADERGAGRPFSPTTDWNDAMEAAKLLLESPSAKRYRLPYELRKVLFGCGYAMPDEQTIPKLVMAGPLAICKAIMAVKEGE